MYQGKANLPHELGKATYRTCKISYFQVYTQWYTCIHNYSRRLSSVTQSCHFLWPSGLYPPGSSVHGIILGRILKWVNISSFRGSSWPGDLPDPGIEPATPASPASPALQVDSILLSHWGSQKTLYTS